MFYTGTIYGKFGLDLHFFFEKRERYGGVLVGLGGLGLGLRWMDGWIDGWVDGVDGVDGWVDRWIGGFLLMGMGWDGILYYIIADRVGLYCIISYIFGSYGVESYRIKSNRIYYIILYHTISPYIPSHSNPVEFHPFPSHPTP